MRRSSTLGLLALVGAALAVPQFGADASPVKCAEDDLSPDGRVFPEPMQSVSYVGFDEFLCGMELLDATYPDLLEITVIGETEGGHPVYNVLMTDETVAGDKGNLLVVSSIHGNEIGGREGAVRQIEDMADPELLGEEDWVQQVLDEYVIHWLFPNTDGWVAGEGVGAYTRGNVNGLDLNRNYPVKGYIAGTPLSEIESVAVDEHLSDVGDWFLGTDNHGQGPDTYAAAGLQIVGQFDYQKSETLARFADGITQEMAEYDVLDTLALLNETTGQDIGPYHWGTLYDMLGYSASGSMIDYYNTPDSIGGYGFATELTIGSGVNQNVYPALLNQVHVDSIRAINATMFKQAIEPVDHVFEVGGRTAYLFDPERIRHDDANGRGYDGERKGEYPESGYDVSRMVFFEDLDREADRPVHKVRIGELVSGEADLGTFDTLVIANDAVPEPVDETAWFELLRSWVGSGGNLVLTDAALTALEPLGLLEGEGNVWVDPHYVGSVEEFTDRSHPLNQNLRGVASQTYDTVPIGYAFGGADGDSAPNWKVDQTAWEDAGGYTAGLHGSGETVYGEMPVGEGRVRILGALLPDPTEEFFHPFGLQNYAVTYTGYTLLQNMLQWENPNRTEPVADAPAAPESAPQPPLPATGGGTAVLALVTLAVGGLLGRRVRRPSTTSFRRPAAA